MLRTGKALAATLVGLACVSIAAPALAQPPVPQSLTVGGRELVLNGYATREAYWADLYTAALYLPQPMTSVDRIDDPSIPKAFHVEVVYGGAMPEDVPEDWRNELLPPLAEEQVATLRSAFENLKTGDVIRITYVPGSGTTVKLNDEVVLFAEGHELMAACLDLWLGPDPVSENLRRELLAGGV